jgi:hypothetical protein
MVGTGGRKAVELDGRMLVVLGGVSWVCLVAECGCFGVAEDG